MSRLEREQLQSARLANAGAAMELFSPNRELDTMLRLQGIREAAGRNDFNEQMSPLELARASLVNRGIQSEQSLFPLKQQGYQLDNEQAGLRNQDLAQRIQMFPQERDQLGEDRELQQTLQLAQLRDLNRRGAYEEEDRGYELGQRQRAQQMTESLGGMSMLKDAGDILTMQPGLQEAVNQQLQLMGLPPYSSMTPEQREAMEMLQSLKQQQ